MWPRPLCWPVCVRIDWCIVGKTRLHRKREPPLEFSLCVRLLILSVGLDVLVVIKKFLSPLTHCDTHITEDTHKSTVLSLETSCCAGDGKVRSVVMTMRSHAFSIFTSYFVSEWKHSWTLCPVCHFSEIVIHYYFSDISGTILALCPLHLCVCFIL